MKRKGYPGSKAGSGVYQTLINLMPPHRVYIEAFLGGGAVMRYKRVASTNIGIDADTQALASFSEDAGGSIPNLQLIKGDAVELLASSPISGDTLVYLDPPYLLSTRSTKRRIYKHEMLTVKEHTKLLSVIKSLDCMVMISGYWSSLYVAKLANWRTVSFQAITRSGKMATEWVWLNFPEQDLLHDYRYLGQNLESVKNISASKTGGARASVEWIACNGMRFCPCWVRAGSNRRN